MKTLAQIMTRQTEINQRMATIRTEASADGTTVERMAELDQEIETLMQERGELQRESVQIRAQAGADFNPVLQDPATDNGEQERSADVYASVAYRQAFKAYVQTGAVLPALRVDESTKTGDIKSVIVPTTVTDRLFDTDPNAGSIFARVTKTNYPAGMAIKTSNFRPELEWVSENSKSDRKKAQSGEIVFSGYKGQIRLAISLEARTMSLAAFEEAMVGRIREAIAFGYDKAIIAGSGSGQPTGIITGANYDKKATTLNNKQVEDYGEWIKVWSKVALKYQGKANLVINKVDWQAHILGMKDSTNKVVALETMGFGGALVPMFMGREVILVEDQGLATFDSITGAAKASKATAFSFFIDLKDYDLNSNMQVTLRKYIDEDTDEEVTKATLLADGKVVDDGSLLVICRGVDAAA